MGGNMRQNQGSADSNEDRAKNMRQQQRNAGSENLRMAGAQSLIAAMKQQNFDKAVIVTAIDPNAGHAAQVENGGVYGMVDKHEEGGRGGPAISKSEKFKQQ